MVTTFNPGPSQLSELTRNDIAEIVASGLLSVSHRTDAIRDIVKRCVSGMRSALSIPADYTILFTTSATAGMDLVLSNCVARASAHFVAGAFAERFAATAEGLGRTTECVEAAWGTPFPWRDRDWRTAPELIAVTHSETSAGSMWPTAEWHGLRERWPDPLLAMDVTSTFGAMAMAWSQADYWFGSVQKCLGLPGGLGFAIVGPRAVQRAAAFGAERRVPAWRDLLVLIDKIDLGDTFETPNVLGLALLDRQMARWDLTTIERDMRAKATLVHDTMGDSRFFVRDTAWRSLTVHNLDVGDPAPYHQRARAAGYELGLGYGPLKKHCLRIATFPAVSPDDVRGVLRAIEP